MGYTGQEMLAEANLIQMGARIYDPDSGVFLSPDPTNAQPDDPRDWNQYAYVYDNPMSYVDPSGYAVDGTPLGNVTVTACLSDTGACQQFLTSAYFSELYTSFYHRFMGPIPVDEVGGPWPDGPKNSVAKGKKVEKANSKCPSKPTNAIQAGIDQVLYTDGNGNWELRYGGSRNWVSNNPNGVGFPWAASHGSIGSYTAKGQTTGIFPSYSLGQQAATSLWSISKYQSQPNLLSAINTWTGKAFTANDSYVKNIVNANPGATANSALNTLKPSNLQIGQQKSEGWTPGQVRCGH